MPGSFRFIHCADLHLGSRFKGISAADGGTGEMLRRSVTESFSRIVDVAIKEGVDAVIISGDIYDDEGYLPSLRLRFSEELKRVKVPVFICRGNHDSHTSWEASIPYPSNVHEFGTEPGSFCVDSPGGRFKVIGISYSEPHERRNLATMLNGDPDMFTIACVHCDIDSASEGYAYAPCKLLDLSGRHVDYWALGHIHKRQVLSEDPWVVYPGNIQGRNIKETGEKGAFLVTVTADKVTGFEFIPAQGHVWKEIQVDISDLNLADAVAEATSQVSEGDLVRVRFVGSGDLDSVLRSNPLDVMATIASKTGCVPVPPVVETLPDLGTASLDGEDMASLIMKEGNSFTELPPDEIRDRILSHKMAAKYKTFFDSLPPGELMSIAEEAAAKAVVTRRLCR